MVEKDEVISELLLRWEESFESGDDLSAHSLCNAYPELEDELQSKIDSLKKMAWMNDSKIWNVEATIDLTGEILGGRYKIEELIGRGGYGEVYKAHDSELDRHVAIKVPTAQIDGITESLLEEARKVAKLQHPGIVAVHDVGRYNGDHFVVSELIEGSTLAEHMGDRQTSTKEAVLLVAEVAENLAAAHKEGFIHRDIKPSNILINKDGKPLITDFGIASTIKNIGESATKGTLRYMSPEQLGEEPSLVDKRTDIYSIGVVLYELLTGQHPHPAKTPWRLKEQILTQPPSDLTTSIPNSVRKICLQCLSKDPADRFESASELAAALRRSLTDNKPKTIWNWLPHVLIAGAIVLAVSVPFLRTNFKNPIAIEERVIDEAFVFDGTDRIVSSLECFYPCTLEAWILTEDHGREQFVIGSDKPNFWGIGIGVRNSNPMAETIGGGFHAPKTDFQLGKWSHLAAVFDRHQTRLYLDGKLVDAGDKTQEPTSHSVFVIGNLGQEHETHYFRGRIRSVKISSRQLYTTKQFTPEEVLVSDPGTLLLYNCDSVVGDRIVDQSGNGNDGRWESN